MTIWGVLTGALIVVVALIAIFNRERITTRIHRLAARKYGKAGNRVASNITSVHVVFWIGGIALVLLVNLVVANAVGRS